MKISIFQINHERDANNVCFLTYQGIPLTQGNTKINASLYDKVFSGDVPCNTLEDVFCMFSDSAAFPSGYTGRFMAISDIVEMDGKFYFCDSIGFREVSFDLEKVLNQSKTNSDSTSISVVLVHPEMAPRIYQIGRSLESMQDIVSGYIEILMPHLNGTVDELNASIGVTKAQAAAMIVGSMFTWDCYAANPNNYDADGNIIPPQKRSEHI